MLADRHCDWRRGARSRSPGCSAIGSAPASLTPGAGHRQQLSWTLVTAVVGVEGGTVHEPLGQLLWENDKRRVAAERMAVSASAIHG